MLHIPVSYTHLDVYTRQVSITAALYCEAMPFIRQLGLKKVTAETKYQLFTNEQFLLIDVYKRQQ